RRRRQRERHRQRGGSRRQQRVGLAQEDVRPAALPPGQRDIQRGERQRAQRERPALPLEQRALQQEGHQRRPEDQARVHHVAPPGHASPRVEQRQRQVEREEQQQERLRARVLRRRVGQRAPGDADAPGEDEAEQVEFTPG